MKELFTNELEAGMITAKDVHSSSGIMIIPSGIVLTEPIISHLKFLGIDSIYIDDEKPQKPEIAQVDRKEFKKFTKKYTQAKDNLNNAFGKIVDRNIDRKEIEKILDDSVTLLDQNDNSYNTISMLYSMHDYSDTTYMHCMNVGIIASLLGRWLGWNDEDVRLLNACGIFHDIGKVLISKKILDKPARLTLEEYNIMKTHTIKGYELLKSLDMDPVVADVAIMHHERCDGSGYPFGITGDKINEFAKVIAIADVYEAMTANRVYRGPVCPFDVIAQFEDTGFGQFDTKYLLVFLQNIVDSYLHANVKLSNGQKAEIILINRQKGSKPVVMTSAGKPVDLLKEKNIKITEVY